MAIIQEISKCLQKGKVKQIKALVQQALDEGEDPRAILNEGLLEGMSVIGGRFKREEIFVPDVLISARTMSMGLSVLEPKLVEVGNRENCAWHSERRSARYREEPCCHDVQGRRI